MENAFDILIAKENNYYSESRNFSFRFQVNLFENYLKSNISNSFKLLKKKEKL